MCIRDIRLSADDAYMVIRGMRTLDLRLNKHQQSANIIARWLHQQKKIIKVLYPFKTSSKNYKLWKKYYSGSSGLLGIIVKSKNKPSVIRFINSLV